MAKVYLDRRSGRWGVDLRVPPTRDGKRVRFLVGSKREAEAVLAERLTAMRQQRFPILKPAPAPPMFDVVGERFLREHASQKRDARSFHNVVRVLRRHFSGLTLQQITPEAIRAFMQARLAEGVTPATANRGRSMLSSLLSWAIDVNLWSGPHPCIRGTPGRVKSFHEPSGRERYLSPDEATRLIRAATSHLREIIIVALHTGMRRGEMLSLRWDQIHDRAIHLRAAQCKSGRARVVPIADAVADVLLLLARNGPLVFHQDGRPILTLRAAWKRACDRAGVRNFRLHDCRHTFSTWAAERGLDLHRLQALLGHSTPQVTARYRHVGRDFLQGAVAFFGPPASASGGRKVGTLALPPAPEEARDGAERAENEESRVEAAIGIEPMYRGFADLCLTAWLRRQPWLLRWREILQGATKGCQSARRARKRPAPTGAGLDAGAGNGSRTRDFNLGKVALYH